MDNPLISNKVVFVNRFFYPDCSATSQLLSDLAFYLGQRDYHVAVVTSRQLYDDPKVKLRSREVLHGVDVHRVWTTRFGRHFLPGRAIDYLTFYTSASWRLFRLLRTGHVVVAKTDPPLISVAAFWVARCRGALVVNWLQDLFPEVAEKLWISGSSGLLGRLLRMLRNRSLRQATLNVVLGKRMQERVAQENVVRERIQIIPNWSDGEAVSPISRRRNPLRKEWDIENRFVVGHSGNLGWAHEHETILGAVERLRGETDIVFLFIGGGAQFERLKAAARAQALGNIQFRPYQSRAKLGFSLTLPDVHVAVLKPEMEGLVVPSKFYGIAAAGRPTIFIGAKSGEIPQVLSETTSGVTVEIGDIDGMVDVILRMKVEPEWRERLGWNARRVFEERYDKRISLAAWDRALQEVMGKADQSDVKVS